MGNAALGLSVPKIAAGSGLMDTDTAYDDDKSCFDRVPLRRELRLDAMCAHHEAGHIVAAWAMRGAVKGANILRNGKFHGAAWFSIDGGKGATVEDVVALLAGPAASKRFGWHFDGGAEDRKSAERALRAMCRSSDAVTIVRRHCEAEAARLVSQNWDAIEAIANALFDHQALCGDDLNSILTGVIHARQRRQWAKAEARAAEPPVKFTRTR